MDRAGAQAVPLWHAEHDLHGVDAVVVPGGFSYGDYLRAGAISRFAPLMTRRLTITGSTLRPQSDLAKAGIAAELARHVWPMVAAGQLRPVMDREFPLADAEAAHRRMEGGDHIGKIVLKVAG